MLKTKHWCNSYSPKPNANGNCGDCNHYDIKHGYCPKNYAKPTDLVHPPVKARSRKGSRGAG